MNKELIKSLYTAYSRTKKHNIMQYIIPSSNGYSISNYSFSALNIKIFYSINSNGIINYHDDEKIFNMGPLDLINVSGYI